MIIDETFCVWDAQTQLDTYIMIFDTFLATLLLLSVIRTFVKKRKVMKRGVTQFYYLMMLWGIIFIAKDLYAVIVFFSEYWPNRCDISEKLRERITYNSKIYQIIDELPELVIQALLLVIPLHIIGNMLACGLLRNKRVKKFVRAARVYLWVRLLILVPDIVILFEHSIQTVETIFQVKVGLVIFDCFVCLSFLLFVTYKSTKQYEPLNQQTYFIDPIKKQLFFLIVGVIFRVLINIYVYYINPAIYQFLDYKNTCFYSKGFYDGDIYFTIANIILVDYFIHLIPIFIIHKMYQPPKLLTSTS